MNWLLLQNSLLVAGLATALAVSLGFIAALWLATLEARWRTVFLALAVVALALPPFLVTNSWISLLGDNGVLRTWLPFRIYSLGGTIWILSLMLWPITLFAVLSAWRRLEAAQFECEPAMTGFALLRWLLVPVARGELALAAVLTSVLALNNFAVPAILQTKVLPDELWVQFNTTFFQTQDGRFDFSAMARLTWPLVIAPVILLAWPRRRTVRWPRTQSAVAARIFLRQLGPSWRAGCGSIAALLGILSVALPLAQIALAKRTWTELPGAVEAGTGAIWNSFWFAALAATVVVTVALWVGAARSELWGQNHGDYHSDPIILTRSAGALAWLPFFMPGVLIGIALIHLFNRLGFASFYQGAGIVLLAFVVRYFAVGWTTARHAVNSTDSDLTDAARLEGATRWQMMRHVVWPQIAPQVFAAWFVVYLLCLWDVESMILVVPPGGETLALRIFNLLHYGHNAQVDGLCVALLGLAVLPLLAWTALGWATAQNSKLQTPNSKEAPSSNRQVPRAAAFLGAWCLKFLWCLVLGAWCFGAGCSPRSELDEARSDSKIFERAIVIGKRGVGLGEFNKPRSVAVDAQDNVYAVDMTGRVQKFSPDGRFLLSWQMPQTDLGKPKGMGRDREGNILVIEPHYQRVNHFTPKGKLLAQWGCKGTNEGCFMLPRAVAVNSRAEIFVSEYMGEERVQKFAMPVLSLKSEVLSQENGGTSPLTPALSPSEGEREERLESVSTSGEAGILKGRALLSPLPRGGGEGQGEGARGEKAEQQTSNIEHPTSNAPLIPALSPSDGERGNRSPSQPSSAAARFLGVIGKAGTGPGEFNRAEGICVDAQDRVYVADSCNHRIQIFSSDGKFIRQYGHAGSGLGELSYPYDITVDASGYQFVCEFGNSRIQVFDANCQPVEIIGGPGAAPGRFANPWGVALDSHGNLYVADALNHRVQKLMRRMGPMGRMDTDHASRITHQVSR